MRCLHWPTRHRNRTPFDLHTPIPRCCSLVGNVNLPQVSGPRSVPEDSRLDRRAIFVPPRSDPRKVFNIIANKFVTTRNDGRAEGRALCEGTGRVVFRDSREITMFTSKSIGQRYMVHYIGANQTIRRSTGDPAPSRADRRSHSRTHGLSKLIQ